VEAQSFFICILGTKTETIMVFLRFETVAHSTTRIAYSMTPMATTRSDGTFWGWTERVVVAWAYIEVIAATRSATRKMMVSEGR
jgi:hypothetical protein